jgi:polyferredoxin
MTDLLEKSGFLRKLILSRWPQIILTILALVMMYMVIMISIFGTKVSGRNLGVLMMWAVWLFLLVAILTPLFGRSWCTICPLPFFGDWFQRRSLFSPERGQTKGYNNKFYGLFLKWPDKLKNSWFRLIVFLILSTFSTTLVAMPWVSGVAILMLILIPTLMSFIWELRAFCRYVCPVSVFVAPFSEMSMVTLKNKSQSVCDKCKPHFCQKGSPSGWACPYGLNVGEMKNSTDCGLCLECVRSCSYKNVSLFRRPFGSESIVRNLSEAWLTIAIFTMAIVYSILYLGVWPVVRDYVNILDKQNWDLFGIYSLLVWMLVLIVVPGILYSLAYIGRRLSKITISTKEVFLAYTGVLLPLGLMLWIAFVIPMLFVNITFIAQSASDPFGWGWDFFGTANIPWHQLLPQYVPWFQAFFILAGIYFSLKNLRKKWLSYRVNPNQLFKISLPIGIFLTSVAVFMLFFFTN